MWPQTERSALIVGAVAAAGAIELVARLATQHDLVIAADAGADICREAWVTPDVVVGDLDSAGAETIAEMMEAGIDVERLPADKDVTDLDAAVAEARTHGATRVTVTCAFSQRLDHTLAAFGCLMRNGDLWPRLEEPSVRGWLMAPESRERLVLSGMGSTVSLLALDSAASVSISGVRWPLSQAVLDPLSSLGVSNLITSPVAEVELHSGHLLVLSSAVASVLPAQESGE